MQGHIIAFVLDCIVHQIEDYVGEMHLICLHHRINSIQLGFYTSSILHHLNIECLDNTIDQFVSIQRQELQSYVVAIIKGHLQNLLHLIPQPFGLAVDNSA